jgi:hypothetical protein
VSGQVRGVLQSQVRDAGGQRRPLGPFPKNQEERGVGGDRPELVEEIRETHNVLALFQASYVEEERSVLRDAELLAEVLPKDGPIGQIRRRKGHTGSNHVNAVRRHADPHELGAEIGADRAYRGAPARHQPLDGTEDETLGRRIARTETRHG